MTRIITVSVTDQHWDLIKHAQLKPTHILRKGLQEYEEFLMGNVLEDSKALNMKVGRLMKTIDEQAQIIIGMEEILTQNGIMVNK